jgi:hypothetical protein
MLWKAKSLQGMNSTPSTAMPSCASRSTVSAGLPVISEVAALVSVVPKLISTCAQAGG